MIFDWVGRCHSLRIDSDSYRYIMLEVCNMTWKTKIIYVLKGHSVVSEEEIQTQKLNINNINKAKIQTQIYLFFLKVNKQAVLRGKYDPQNTV